MVMLHSVLRNFFFIFTGSRIRGLECMWIYVTNLMKILEMAMLFKTQLNRKQFFGLNYTTASDGKGCGNLTIERQRQLERYDAHTSLVI